MDEKRIARFWSRVDRRGPDECWGWTAGTQGNGYGRLRIDRRRVLAHRMAWELTFGPIPAGTGYHGTCVCHRCDDPSCCNPAHMFLGTHADNMTDRDRKGRNRPPRGSGQGAAILDEQRVALIRELYATGEYLQRELGQKFGVHKSTITAIASRRTWKHVP
jgi:HNH endonuclease